MAEVPPIRRELVVELGPEPAFELFTGRIGEWWPLERFSVFGDGTSVAFVGGELIETCGERRARWGSVTDWVPGRRVAFSWHPGAAQEQPSSHVSVSFHPEGTGTRVILEHSGWEAYEDPEGTRSEYDQGWPTVLGCYGDAAAAGGAVSGSAEPPEAESYTWVALLHRPGPAAPADRSVFEDPAFAQHVEFLGRMREVGYLVAAGPLLDAAGEGMTVLRLPGKDRLEEAERLATQDDLSVRSGFFQVTVRPWQVVMALDFLSSG